MAKDTDEELYGRKDRLISNHTLLLVIGTMATLTFGMFAWDAERALSQLDNLSTLITDTNTKTAENTGKIQSLSTVVMDVTANQVPKIEAQVDNHEVRISVLESRKPAH